MPSSVDELAQEGFDVAAVIAHEQLEAHGCCLLNFEPGDMSRYTIAVMQEREPGVVAHTVFTDDPHDIYGWEITDRYWLATQYGPLYRWDPKHHVHWDYVASHFVADRREWTARVLARFLNTLSDLIAEHRA